MCKELDRDICTIGDLKIYNAISSTTRFETKTFVIQNKKLRKINSSRGFPNGVVVLNTTSN